MSIGILFVVQYGNCLGATFGFFDNPVEVLNEHLSLLVGRYVPTKVIRVRTKDKPWFDDQYFWTQAGGSSSVHP